LYNCIVRTYSITAVHSQVKPLFVVGSVQTWCTDRRCHLRWSSQPHQEEWSWGRCSG